MAVETNTIDNYFSLLKEVIEPTLRELKYEVLGTGKYARFIFGKGKPMWDIPSKALSGGSGVPAPMDQRAITIIDEHGTKELIALGLIGDKVIINNLSTINAEYIPLNEVTPERIKEAVCTAGSIKL